MGTILPCVEAEYIAGSLSAWLLAAGRRLRPGRNPPHRRGLGDDVIDMIAIDALKCTQLETDAPGFDTLKDHGLQTFETGMGLNRYAA